MMTNNLDKAAAHTKAAIRRLEMMLWFINQKKIKPENHIPAYFDLVANDLVQIQNAILTDDEYTEYVASGLARVSKTHTYDYQVTANNDGKVFYNVDALLPLKEMKENVIFVRSLP
jgi:hypothetical protein